jgi:hypothetical protein
MEFQMVGGQARSSTAMRANGTWVQEPALGAVVCGARRQLNDDRLQVVGRGAGSL